jgi:hypothetical protein
MKTNLLLLVAATSLLGLTACHGAHLETPGGFAEIGGDKYDYRASNPEGVMVAVKSHPNDLSGNLEFWSRVVSHRLEEAGYRREDGDPRAVKTGRGLEGRQLKYTVDRNGRPHAYVVTLFVTPSRVYVVEAGGDTAYVDAKVTRELERAIASLDAG